MSDAYYKRFYRRTGEPLCPGDGSKCAGAWPPRGGPERRSLSVAVSSGCNALSRPAVCVKQHDAAKGMLRQRSGSKETTAVRGGWRKGPFPLSVPVTRALLHSTDTPPSLPPPDGVAAATGHEDKLYQLVPFGHQDSNAEVDAAGMALSSLAIGGAGAEATVNGSARAPPHPAHVSAALPSGAVGCRSAGVASTAGPVPPRDASAHQHPCAGLPFAARSGDLVPCG